MAIFAEMKKLSKKEVGRREWEWLKENKLTAEELQVIRKLNGASSVPGYNTVLSKRTIEAMLQGRRTADPELLRQAIRNAKANLDDYTVVMDGIVKKISGF